MSTELPIEQNRILITGSNGQLGSEIRKLIPGALFTDVQELDITSLENVKEFVNKHEIETIINCAAYTAVDKAEDDAEVAFAINAEGPCNLAATGCRLIHISTDYVFDGSGCRPYIESDPANPVSVYGKTKLEGEKKVLSLTDNAVILRTAWLYSATGNNFVKTMLRLGRERSTVGVVCDQIGSPTFAGDLAEAICRILPKMNNDTTGVYHYTNEGVCSWYDFAWEIMKKSGSDCKVLPLTSSDYPTRAQRPSYSVLSKRAVKETFDLEIPYWKESLEKCLKQF